MMTHTHMANLIMNGFVVVKTGRLVNDDGDEVMKFEGKLDVIPLKTILETAHIDLDDENDVIDGETYRNAGAIILFGIDYNVEGDVGKNMIDILFAIL